MSGLMQVVGEDEARCAECGFTAKIKRFHLMHDVLFTDEIKHWRHFCSADPEEWPNAVERRSLTEESRRLLLAEIDRLCAQLHELGIETTFAVCS